MSLRSSNPTWIKLPKTDNERLDPTVYAIAHQFAANVRGMSEALAAKQLIEDAAGDEFTAGTSTDPARRHHKNGPSRIKRRLRTDLAALLHADRLYGGHPCRAAVLAPLLKVKPRELGSRMIGSVQVPKATIEIDKSWGPTCATFLDALKAHPSKASAGYYYKTHLDYFDKVSRSLGRIATALKPGGRAVFVVQDSYYKDIHNDLPQILKEIGARTGLTFSNRRIPSPLDVRHEPGPQNLRASLGRDGSSGLLYQAPARSAGQSKSRLRQSRPVSRCRSLGGRSRPPGR